MRRRTLRLAFVAATLSTGCNSLFGIHEGAPRPICADVNPEEPLIDDMEDGDGFICALSGRSGHWFAVGDGTSRDLTPERGFEPTKIPGGERGTSQYAARIKGSGFIDWGVLMGFDLNLGGLAYDARPANGIKFWMKSDVPVTFSTPIPDTISPATGGRCADTASTHNCENHFQFEITAPSLAWREYEVPFDALRQLPGGSASWNPRELSVIQFNVPPGAAFDVWIDDVRFYSLCPSNAGCAPTCADPAFPVSCPSNARDPAACRPPGTDCAAAASWCADPLIVDDMEDGNSAICHSDGRRGGWFVVGDGTPHAELMPAEGKDFVQSAIPGGRGASHYAARLTGSGFTDSGALLGVTLADGAQPHVYDASGFSGIRFWMKNSVPTMVLLHTAETIFVADGGQCADGPGQYNCNNNFSFKVTAPSNDWVEYDLPFSAFSQTDGSATWNPSHLMNIGFAARRDAPFDVWVDDLQFYECAASPCLPTCADPAFPVQCTANAQSPAGCRRPGTDCATFVLGCGASNTTRAPADGHIATFLGADSAPVIPGHVVATGAPAPTHTADGTLHITLDAPATSHEHVVVDRFEDCVDATAFTGVQFSISGSLSGCTLGYFTEDSVHLYDDGSPTSYASHGIGRPATLPPVTKLTAAQVTSVARTVRVPFAAQSGGVPDRPIETAKVTGVGWMFLVDPSNGTTTPDCVADLTIEDVSFYE
jgi:hypothetical protein